VPLHSNTQKTCDPPNVNNTYRQYRNCDPIASTKVFNLDRFF